MSKAKDKRMAHKRYSELGENAMSSFDIESSTQKTDVKEDKDAEIQKLKAQLAMQQNRKKNVRLQVYVEKAVMDRIEEDVKKQNDNGRGKSNYVNWLLRQALNMTD